MVYPDPYGLLQWHYPISPESVCKLKPQCPVYTSTLQTILEKGTQEKVAVSMDLDMASV